MLMVIWLCLRWWYGAGWEWALRRAIVQRLRWCNETFSIFSLIRTWGSPFKQSHGIAGASLDSKIHMMIDNLVSRMVGFFARSFIIFTGAVASLLAVITGFVFVALWPLAPLAIPISLGMIVFGVGR